jgi:glycosyltransferase involved in cell wall biosynthesis
MRIGIGISSYKRPKECKICSDSIISHLGNNHTYQLLCSVDNEDDGSYRDCMNGNFNYIFHKNGGVSANKNRILSRLKDNDLIFIFEDDIKVRKGGFIELFLTAIKETGMQHYNYIRLDHRTEMYALSRTNSLNIGFFSKNTAQLMVFTKEVVEKVGAFNPKFGKYGFEHSDYTRRCKGAGFCIPPHHDIHPHILDLDMYIEEMNIEPCYNLNDRTKYSEEANKIYMDFDPRRIFIPFPEGDY